MTIEAPTKPTLAERLASASNSRDLSVNVDTRTDADYLISSGIQPAKLGRLVYQLMSEWDARLKPRVLTDADIEAVAQQMPRLVKRTTDRRGVRETEALDLVGARAAAAAWLQHQRIETLTKLPTFPRLMDAHAGFMPRVLALGVADARTKLVDVLLWWCDRRCPVCGGTNLAKGKTCKACHGFGTRDVPHGAEGLRISEHIAAEVDASRAGTAAALKRMNALKKFASGKN